MSKIEFKRKVNTCINVTRMLLRDAETSLKEDFVKQRNPDHDQTEVNYSLAYNKGLIEGYKHTLGCLESLYSYLDDHEVNTNGEQQTKAEANSNNPEEEVDSSSK